MESQNGFITDLTDRSNDIIIMQPAITAGMRKFDDLRRILCRNSSLTNQHDWERSLWEIIRDVAEPKHFVHTGNLKTRCIRLLGTNPEAGKSYYYKYCGGFCQMAPDNEGRLAWYCENCQTKMHFRYIKQTDIPSLLLHLLIKQMVPTLRTCNHIWTEETGVIALQYESLSYKNTTEQDISFSWTASLGFTLMPGMQTLNNLGGFDEWLRYLVQIKFDQLQVVAESQLPYLIGPKHMGELNRGLRFWR